MDVEPPLSLRERKKQATRRTIVDSAERLFEERGFDAVTVAEIADAANVSVKTLFVYFRSKDDLAFARLELLDDVVAAVASAGTDEARVAAVRDVLVRALAAEPGERGIEGYHRAVGDSPGLRGGVLRMWDDLERRVTEAVAGAGDPATPRDRLVAMQLVALVRLVVSPELRAQVAGLDPPAAARLVRTTLDRGADRLVHGLGTR